MEKRADGISKILIKYIISIFGLLFGSAIIILILGLYITARNGYRPANATEKEVETWLAESKQSGTLDFKKFPSTAEYILADKSGNIISQSHPSVDKPELNAFISESSKYNSNEKISGNNVYLRENYQDDLLYINYRIGYKYEYQALLLVILIFALDVLVPTLFLIKRIKKAIGKVNEYALLIGKEELSSNSQTTDIKEINNIITAIDTMKTELVSTLEGRWKEQQEKKRQMAQIAHDLKTPLTIIRGNADLLLEDETDSEKIESINSIISNSERIARSVLEILEREEHHDY